MKYSAKEKSAIALIAIQFVLTIGNTLRAGGSVSIIIIPLIFELLPHISVILLLYYEHKFQSPIIGNFSLLRKWEFVLLWIQPALSIISFMIAGVIADVVWSWVGGCVFIVIATVLLYQDGNLKGTANFIKQCESIIDTMEKGLPLGTQSCKNSLVELLQKEKIEKMPNETQIYELLAATSFSLLSSGEYNIYSGQIDPNGIGVALNAVFDGCLDKLLKDGKISQEEYDRRHAALKKNVSEVG